MIFCGVSLCKLKGGSFIHPPILGNWPWNYDYYISSWSGFTRYNKLEEYKYNNFLLVLSAKQNTIGTRAMKRRYQRQWNTRMIHRIEKIIKSSLVRKILRCDKVSEFWYYYIFDRLEHYTINLSILIIVLHLYFLHW